MIHTRLRIIALGLFLSFLLPLCAQVPQEILGPEILREVPWLERQTPTTRASRDTLRITPGTNQSFFDDFAQSSPIPSPSLWYNDAGRYPLIRQQSGRHPRSVGTATFDGISPFNQTYSNLLRRGSGDRLETHYFDLSVLDPDANVVVSFYLQAKGYGHAPNDKDSFKVYFNAQLNGVESEELVFKTSGQQASQGFVSVALPIDRGSFFHDHFYVAFENEGLLCGMLSMWHLDYFALGTGRGLDDTTVNDQAMIRLASSPFAPYTAIPFMQYRPNTFSTDFMVESRQSFNNSPTLQVEAQLEDPVGGNLPTPYVTNATQSFGAPGVYQTSVPTFNDNLPLNSPYASTFDVNVSFTNASDLVSVNNELNYSYRIDSLFALDDGEADVGYGLNRPRGFAQKYVLQEPDSLMALWVHFVPQIDYVRGGSLKDKPFTIALWTAPNRDSLVTSEAFNVEYGGIADTFVRYAFSEPISVSGDIWAGIIQLDNVPIGVGLDRTYNNDNIFAWDSSGVWVNSRLEGSLMIRPELRNIRFNPLPFPASVDKQNETRLDLKIFPNPSNYSSPTRWHIENPLSLRPYTLEVWNMMGQRVWVGKEDQASGTLPPFSPGTYVLHIRQQGLFASQKFWVR